MDGRFVPLYLLGSVPTVGSGDLEDVTASLLDEFGGAVNL
jgi:hypothetical protein